MDNKDLVNVCNNKQPSSSPSAPILNSILCNLVNISSIQDSLRLIIIVQDDAGACTTVQYFLFPTMTVQSVYSPMLQYYHHYYCQPTNQPTRQGLLHHQQPVRIYFRAVIVANLWDNNLIISKLDIIFDISPRSESQVLQSFGIKH